MNEYFELADQPAMMMPYTSIEVIASSSSRPALTLASAACVQVVDHVRHRHYLPSPAAVTADLVTLIGPNMSPRTEVSSWAAATRTTFAGRRVSIAATSLTLPWPCETVTSSPALTPSCAA